MGSIRANLPAGGPQEYKGVIVKPVGAPLAVNVNGNVIPVRWADPLVVSPGDPVLVAITGAASGGYEAFVRCRLTSSPRPAAGTIKVVPAASPTITVTGADGTDYVANFASSYTPTVGDSVLLAWNAAQPTVVAKVGATAAPPPPPPTVPPPPPAPTTGRSYYAATDSATWVPQLGVWDAWAGGGGNVYQGSNGGYTTYGAWFYSGSPSELAGRPLNAITVRIGSRRQVGAYDSPVTVHLYAHTNRTRPAGDVTRVSGPLDITIQPGSGPVDYTLTPANFGDFTAFANALTGGGGLAIAGDSYAGVLGRYTQPDSGNLTFDWSR